MQSKSATFYASFLTITKGGRGKKIVGAGPLYLLETKASIGGPDVDHAKSLLFQFWSMVLPARCKTPLSRTSRLPRSSMEPADAAGTRVLLAAPVLPVAALPQCCMDETVMFISMKSYRSAANASHMTAAEHLTLPRVQAIRSTRFFINAAIRATFGSLYILGHGAGLTDLVIGQRRGRFIKGFAGALHRGLHPLFETRDERVDSLLHTGAPHRRYIGGNRACRLGVI